MSETWLLQQQFGVCVCVCIFECMCAPEFVWIITSTIVGGFQNKLTQLFSITCRCVIWNIRSGRPKVKVTHEGWNFFYRTLTPILHGFQYKLAQLCSIMSRYAIWSFHLGRSKVKVMQVWWVVPGQPSSLVSKTSFSRSWKPAIALCSVRGKSNYLCYKWFVACKCFTFIPVQTSGMWWRIDHY